MNKIITKFTCGYDSNKTYYESKLDSNTIPSIYIHGVGLDNSMWHMQKKYFKKNIIFYDLINHGKTKIKSKKINYDDFNSQLLNLIHFFNLKKINLIGFSFGSIIALNFSIKFKSIINKLILISPIYQRTNKEKRLVNTRYLEAKKNSISDLAIKRWFTKNYLKKNPKVYKFFFDLLENNNKKDFLAAYKLFATSSDINANFEQINIPTLIMTGEKDKNSTPNMSVKLNKKIKNSKLKIISNSKHMFLYEKNILINTKIQKFLG